MHSTSTCLGRIHKSINILKMDVDLLKKTNVRTVTKTIISDLTTLFLDLSEFQSISDQSHVSSNLQIIADDLYEIYTSGELLSDDINIEKIKQKLKKNILLLESMESTLYRFYIKSYTQIRTSERKEEEKITMMADILKQIKMPSREYNIFSVHIFNNFKQLCAETNPNIHFNGYGVHNLTFPNKEYKKILKIPLSKLKTTSKAFDVVTYQTNFRTLADLNDITQEYSCDSEIRRAISLLRQQGVFIALLPVWTLRKNISRYILKNLKDIHVIPIEEKLGTVLLYGIRKRVLDPVDLASSQRIATIIRNAFKLSNALPEPFDEEHVFPRQEIPIEEFRTIYLSTEDVREAIKKSALAEKILELQTQESSMNIQPLLPFTQDQLGIMLTSGILNGIITEKDGSIHMIKGVAFKDPITQRNHPDEHTLETKTVLRNRVQLTVCAPDGLFINLI